MLKRLSGNLLKLLLLYLLAYGIVGLLRHYSLVTLPVEIDGKPHAHMLVNYILWFFMYPSANLLDTVKGVGFEDTSRLPDYVLTLVFFILAIAGLALRRHALVVLAVVLPIAATLLQMTRLGTLP